MIDIEIEEKGLVCDLISSQEFTIWSWVDEFRKMQHKDAKERRHKKRRRDFTSNHRCVNRPLSKLRFCRFLGSFEPIFDFKTRLAPYGLLRWNCDGFLIFEAVFLTYLDKVGEKTASKSRKSALFRWQLHRAQVGFKFLFPAFLRIGV